MTDVQISDLLSGENLRTRRADAVFTQDGLTYKGSIRPNPPAQINILNQAQLEDELGVDLFIPDDTVLTIIIDDSLTLDKPIKLGLNSVLSISASTSANILTYTGSGALFQNTNSSNTIVKLEIKNLHIIGDTTNSTFDIIGNSQSAFICDNVIFQDLNSVGTIDTAAADFTACSMKDITQGVIFKNQGMITIDKFSLDQPSLTGLTAFTFTSVVTPMNVTIGVCKAIQSIVGNSLFCFDPNSPAGSIYTVKDSDRGLGDFYRLGTTKFVNSVGLDEEGNIQFVTITAHNVVIGQLVVLKDFTEGNYNGTFIVTQVDTPLTGQVFSVDVNFSVSSTGNMNESSLDQIDPLVLARDNKGMPDSGIRAEIAAGLIIVTGDINVDVPLVNEVSSSNDWIQDPITERFSVDATSGIVTYTGIIPVTVLIKYSLDVSAFDANTQTLEISLHIGAFVQSKSRVGIIIPDGNISVPVVYGGGSFSLNPGDTLQLFKKNVINSINTMATNVMLSIDRF